MGVQVVLAVSLASVFLAAGGVKLLLGQERNLRRMPWAEDFSVLGFGAIAVVELVAAVGLLLGSFAGDLTFLTPVSAAVLSAVMLGAGAVHIRRREYANLVPVLALLALSLTVLMGSQ